MNRREAVKYSFRILRRKNTIISGVFLILAFYWLGCSWSAGRGLHREMSEPVKIQCIIQENSLEKLKKAEGVSAVTQYRESLQTIEFQGYAAQVTVKGMEETFISQVYSEILQAPFTESMPCLIINTSAFNAMENEKKEKMKDVFRENMIFQTLSVGEHLARIYGIIEESSDKVPPYILTTMDGYETLIAYDGEEEELKAPETETYYMEVMDGYSWKKLEDQLDSWGVTVLYGNGTERNTKIWKNEEEGIRQQLTLCLMSILCGGILIFYQGCLWKQEHQSFIRYLNQIDKTGKSFRRLYRGRIILYIIMGILGGLLMYTIRILFL